ncbi:MAG: hypothetical protein WAV10_00210 [Minisyncoccia bacterium]
MKKIYTISFLIILALVAISLFIKPKIQAASVSEESSQISASYDLYGYAWSDTVGWISFSNCVNPATLSTCTGVGYGVKYNSTSGDVTGYAWSPNIGWVKFGGLSGFPVGGSSQTNANINLTTGKLTGWVKSVSGGTTNAGGWDGWINLSSTSPVYGPSFNMTTGVGSGFAWGSTVVGWIDFSLVRIIPANVPLLFLRANNDQVGTTIILGNSVTLSSVGDKLNSGVAGTANWSGDKTCPGSLTTPNVHVTFTPTSLGSTTYTLTCPTITSGNISSSVTVSVVNPTSCNNDGIQNNGEEGIDCGGTDCFPCKKPPHFKEN